MASYPRVWAEVNLDNIKHNIKTIKKLLHSKALFMAVVKADGYGHGAVQVSKAALEAGADRLGVATIDEASQLRNAGIKAPIHLLIGFEKEKASRIVKLNLIPAVYADEQIKALNRFKKKINVHVKVDTGMGRIGLRPERIAAFVKEIKKSKNIKVEGVFTHLATADVANNPNTKRQLKTFNRVIRSLAAQGISYKLNHAANSAATILYPGSRLQMVRIGIALYGLQPSEATKGKIKLKPALSLKSKLSFVKDYKAEHSVSYGATYTLKKDSVIGTVPVGYADGYSRVLSGDTCVLIGGKKVKQVGRICMDQFMVDLNEVKAKEGDKVVLIGKQNGLEISADYLAEILKTINYEIVCSIASRVPRFYEEL